MPIFLHVFEVNKNLLKLLILVPGAAHMDTLFCLCSPGLHPDNQPVEYVYHLLPGRPAATDMNVLFHSVYGCLAIVSSGNKI